MPCCAIYGCNNYNRKTKGTDIRYFSFPKSQLSRQWLMACRRKDKLNLKNACVCSVHFDSDCFDDISIKLKYSYYKGKSIRNLKPTAIPTLNLPFEKKQNSERSERLAKRIKRMKDNNTTTGSHSIEHSTGEVDDNRNVSDSLKVEVRNIRFSPSAAISDESNNHVYRDYEEEINVLRKKIAALQEQNEHLTLAFEKIWSEWDNARKMLKKFFSPGEIDRIMKTGKNCRRWSPEDMASAI